MRWFRSKRPNVELDKIRSALFPELETHFVPDESGNNVMIHVDRAIDSNLEAVLVDLQSGHNDLACHETLNDVIKRLHRARKILGAYAMFNPKAKYIVVENESDTRGNDDIVPAYD